MQELSAEFTAIWQPPYLAPLLVHRIRTARSTLLDGAVLAFVLDGGLFDHCQRAVPQYAKLMMILKHSKFSFLGHHSGHSMSAGRMRLAHRLSCATRMVASMLALGFGTAALAASNLTFTGLQPSPVETYHGDMRQLEYEFVNTSDKALKIESVFPRKGKGSGEAQPQSLAPGEKGKIILTFTFPESIGRGQVNFLVKTDSPELRTQVIEVPYFVQSAFEPELAVFDFGDIHPGQRLRSTLKVSSRLVPDLTLDRVVSKPEWLEVSFVKTGKTDPQSIEIVAVTTSLPPFGLNSEDIVIASNVTDAPQLRIPAVIRSFSKYGMTPFPLTLGAVHEGLDKKAKLRIHRWDAADVRIREIETGSPALSAKTEPCGESCVDLTVTFDSMRARGGLRTVLTVHFTDDEVPLRVPIDALVVPIGVKMKNLGDLNAVTVKSTTTVLESQH